MKHSINTRKTQMTVFLNLVLSFIFCVHSIRSIYILSTFETPQTLMVFMAILLLIALASCGLMFESLTKCIEITEDGLSAFSLFHKGKSICWKEIREVGVGQTYTPLGIQFCVYFSKEPLTFAEIDNLDLANEKCLYLRTITKQNYERICKYLADEEAVILKKWVK